MRASSGAIEYRRLRAPREHGVTLVEPPLGEVSRLVEENARAARAHQFDCQGRPLAALARQAREQLLQAASEYTARYRSADQGQADGPVLLTGHQPELYHPGVWFKNFALSAAARRSRAFAVNLLIDNDTIRSAAIRVPQGPVRDARADYVAYDRWCEETPFEEREIRDADLFASFGRRLEGRLAPWVSQPLVGALWPLAMEASRRQANLGRCLSEARHRLEGEWGLATWELPLSVICQSEPFRWFVVHVLAQLPCFRDIYNASLAEYRRVHRVRSRTHPVPALTRHGEWIEAPFWIWTDDIPRRRRLFVRHRRNDVELSDLGPWQSILRLTGDSGGAVAVGQLEGMEARGVRIRPRALLTTMFARLFLCDLFFHGIGGAKYDQLTDLIIERFFHRDPPSYLVLTATAKLPIERSIVSRDDFRRVNSLLRQLRFNPQRYADGTKESGPWVAAKQRWIEGESSSQDRRARHREVVEINEALQPCVSLLRSQAMEERERCRAMLRSEKILGSREYSFCLFPEASLRFLLLDF